MTYQPSTALLTGQTIDHIGKYEYDMFWVSMQVFNKKASSPKSTSHRIKQEQQTHKHISLKVHGYH
tara:strand:+ start:64 stop:261 length:198 start_codon:yes stop_codon:yes gene_type:complete